MPVFADVNMNFTFFSFAQDLIFYYGMELPKSDLLPTKNNTELYAFALHRSYQDFVAFSKLYGLDKTDEILADIENQ